jgi:HD-like signal output (HDOD) protein
MYETLINEYDGKFGRGHTVNEIVDWVEDLPPMPGVVTQALRLVDDPDTPAEELAKIIMLDQALAMPILRAANSVRYGQRREVTTLESAILVVGMGQIKTLLMASALRRWNRSFGPIERLIWEKSIGVAAGARVVCEQRRKYYRDELYLTGLLHNLGQMVLLSHEKVSGEYQAVLNRMRQHKEDFAAAERAVIGFSHPLIGALVARKWGFPLAICQTILRYNEPLDGVSGEEDEKMAMLKLAVGIAQTLGVGQPEGCVANPRQEMEQYAGWVGFPAETLAADLDKSLAETKSCIVSDLAAFA